MTFIEMLKRDLELDKRIMTENGAVGYATTGKKLLDLNFATSSLRNETEAQIWARFLEAYKEDAVLAIKWLFFARDIRGGLGERRTFRAILRGLALAEPKIVSALIPLVAEYGRYDDLWELIGTNVQPELIKFIDKQLIADRQNQLEGKSYSLLAKWLPSENASSAKSKANAKVIRTKLGVSARFYRKMLSALRKDLDIVETKMSNKDWESINYEGVPSRANLIYNNAFLRNDEDRRRAYLNALDNGAAKINSSTLYPYEIACKYRNGVSRLHYSRYDAALEAMWNSLPNTVKDGGDTLVVSDGSGSMTTRLPGSTATALDVSISLAVYFAERMNGAFKNHFITFGNCPRLVDISNKKTVFEKLKEGYNNTDCSNTDIERTFDLILTTAIKNHMTQDDMPKNILIISDMEFDGATTYYRNSMETLFETIAKKFAFHGYKMPRLVFWNVCSRTNTIPVRENELGVALVSGFSPNIADMVMSNELDPYKCLVNKLNSKRYQAIEEVIKNII